MRKLLAGLALVLLLPLALRADVAAAKAAFNKGLALEQAKRYPEAIQAYQAALAAEPRYAWANKQMGNCYYYQGQKAEALRHYDAYLALVKNDPKTQAFADKVRAQLGGAAAATAAVKNPAAPALRHWRLAPTFGYHLLSFKDWNDLWSTTGSTPSGVSYPTVNSGLSVGAALGYKLNPKFEFGVDIDDYLVGASYSATGFSALYSFNMLWLGPSASYTFMGADKNFSLNGGAGLGYMTLLGAGATGSGSTSTFSGGGFGFKVKLGADWRLGRLFSLSLDTGYRLASIGTVTSTSSSSGGGGSGNSSTLKKKGGTDNLALDYSGVDIKLGLNFHF